jgi:ADP-ribose pyrophosphatase YjhB (NUDIX family)
MGMSDYQRELREAVGSRYVMTSSVTGLIFDADRRLLALRENTPTESWMLPGGAVDPDESPKDAVVREVAEETGLQVCVESILGAYGGPEFRVSYPNGDECGYVMIVYTCTVAGGELRIDSDEVAEARFVTRTELAELPTRRWISTVVADIPGDSFRA